MNRISLTVVFIQVLLLGLVSQCLALDDVGLYFDEQFLVNCLPDSTSKFPVDAYLVLENCSDPDGVSGWEGRIGLPPTITLMSVDLGENAVNIGSTPEYVVGYAAPLVGVPYITLARFSFFVFGPGEIFFLANENSSISGNLYPVFASGSSPESLTRMNYAYGDPFHAIATVRLAECPQDTFYQAQATSGDIQWETQIPDAKQSNMTLSFVEEVQPEPSTKGTVEEALLAWGEADICFTGVVVDTEVDCYQTDFSKEGFIRAVFQVEVTYWGPEFDEIVVWFSGVEIPGCVNYSDNAIFKHASQISVGKRITLAPTYEDGVFNGRTKRLIFESGASSEMKSVDSKNTLISMGAAKSFSGKATSSSHVLVLRPIDEQPPADLRFAFEIRQIISGGVYTQGQTVKIKFPIGYTNVFGEDLSELDALCFLKLNDQGELVFDSMMQQIYFLTENGFVTPSGLAVDVLGGQ